MRTKIPATLLRPGIAALAAYASMEQRQRTFNSPATQTENGTGTKDDVAIILWSNANWYVIFATSPLVPFTMFVILNDPTQGSVTDRKIIPLALLLTVAAANLTAATWNRLLIRQLSLLP
jgi:hypothetical protein